jgi:hypothetical protein
MKIKNVKNASRNTFFLDQGVIFRYKIVKFNNLKIVLNVIQDMQGL